MIFCCCFAWEIFLFRDIEPFKFSFFNFLMEILTLRQFFRGNFKILTSNPLIDLNLLKKFQITNKNRFNLNFRKRSPLRQHKFSGKRHYTTVTALGDSWHFTGRRFYGRSEHWFRHVARSDSLDRRPVINHDKRPWKLQYTWIASGRGIGRGAQRQTLEFDRWHVQ